MAPRGAAAGPARGDRALERGIEALAGRFLSRFRERVPSPRTVGREAEFTLVRPDGRAGDSALLWEPLLEATGGRPVHDQPAPDGSRLLVGVETDRWSCLAEVGRGTIEVGVGPAPSLGGLARDLQAALGAILPVVHGTGQRLLGYGIQPRTPPHPGLMTPKRRYLAFLEVVGRSWLRFGLTASDQVHVDAARDELVPMMNAINAASGAIVALTANSSVYGGRAGRFASGREGLMRRMVPEPFRHGAVPRPFVDAAEQAADALTHAMEVFPEGIDWPIGFREIRLRPGSIFAGRPVREVPLRAATGSSILAVSRAGRVIYDPDPEFRLFPGDRLVVMGPPAGLKAAEELLGRPEAAVASEEERFVVEEIAVPCDSDLVGRSLAEVGFRQRYAVTVVGIRRGGRRIVAPAAEEPIAAEDRLVVLGRQEAVARLRRECPLPAR